MDIDREKENLVLEPEREREKKKLNIRYHLCSWNGNLGIAMLIWYPHEM